MRPNAFAYSRPTSIAGILSQMRDGAVPLAGGQSLMQAMRLRLTEPSLLVDLAAASDLPATIELHPEQLTIGAKVTHRMMVEHVGIAHEFPWLNEAARALGDVQVRNRGTVVGNLCWADPRANWCVALAASRATIRCRDPLHPEQTESLAIEDFFTGFRCHALNGRLALAIDLPRAPRCRGVYREFSRQRQDLALANICIVLGAGVARVAVGGVHHSPVRLHALEEVLRVETRFTAAVEHALEAAFKDLNLAAIPDDYGSAAYKQQLAKVQLRRALQSLLNEAEHG